MDEPAIGREVVAGDPVPPPEPDRQGPAASTPGGKSLISVDERVAKVVETVAASAGVVTGFLVFFGWTYIDAYFDYFGISQRLLQYSVRDQLLLSAQPMFGTAVLVLVVVAGVLLFDLVSRPLRRRTDRLGSSARLSTVVAGVLFSAVGLMSALAVPPFLELLTGKAAALLLLAGALILLLARWTAGQPSDVGRKLERTALVSASIIATFWVATVYAAELGGGSAEDVNLTPARLPLVTIFSKTYLDLPGSSVTATEQRTPAGEPLYRFTGLRLLAYSNNRWFLISGSHEGYRLSVTVLRDNPELRAEVAQQK